MDTTATTNPAPNRLIAAFLDKKERILAALCDEGGLFEIRLLRRWLKREQEGVALAAASAGTIKVTVCTLREKVTAALAPDDNTPGEFDAEETAALLEDLKTLGLRTTRHAVQLERLS